jgi:metal-sulfur cluster biosynthetic enzyme
MKMPVLDVGLPSSVSIHKSGGRDQWSEPMAVPPEDPDVALFECLREVLDPEIPISLVDLGLIYDARLQAGVAHVDLTFTATACPCMEFIREDVSDRLLQEHWVDGVEIHEVWDPPWSTDRISEAGRATLKKLGVGAV